MSQTHIIGSILGTALGDSIGLPYEGLSRNRCVKLLGSPDRHRFFFGRGMISDDTEHACMVMQSLIASGCDLDKFCRVLGWRFRLWLATISAGIGLATLRSIIRLWLGFSPQGSGVFSAGNGSAMRAAIIGAAIDDCQLMRKLVRVSSRITHTDPKAEFGAFAVALAAQMARQQDTVTGEQFVDELCSNLDVDGVELISLLRNAAISVANGQSTQSFAKSLGLSTGVSGYIYHSVPVAIHGWLRHQKDFRLAITSVIECGGDTDSTAAIVGGIIGAGVGEEGIPSDWLSGLIEWPCSVSYMKRLGRQLHHSIKDNQSFYPIKLPLWGLLLRNLFFLIVVLYHGFRRLLPPY